MILSTSVPTCCVLNWRWAPNWNQSSNWGSWVVLLLLNRLLFDSITEQFGLFHFFRFNFLWNFSFNDCYRLRQFKSQCMRKEMTDEVKDAVDKTDSTFICTFTLSSLLQVSCSSLTGSWETVKEIAVRRLNESLMTSCEHDYHRYSLLELSSGQTRTKWREIINFILLPEAAWNGIFYCFLVKLGYGVLSLVIWSFVNHFVSHTKLGQVNSVKLTISVNDNKPS